MDYQNPVHVATEPWFLLFAGNIPEAVTKAEKVAERFSENAPVQVLFGHCCRAAGDTDKALKQYDRALKIDFLADCVAAQGFVYGQIGRSREAMQSLELLRQKKDSGVIVYISGWHEALVYTGLGENQKALDALERAFDEKCDWLIHMAVEPRWKTLRSERRFRVLTRRVSSNSHSTTLP